MSRNVLFYYPSNKRSIQIETLLGVLKDQGFNVLFLSILEEGAIHSALIEKGIDCHSANAKNLSSIRFYLFQIRALISFTKTHKIDVVLSNLQQANLIAVIAQFFFKSTLICFRHHFKFLTNKAKTQYQLNKNEKIGDWIVNKLAKQIVVPSSGVYNGMTIVEGVNKSKLQIIPYIYNFNAYNKPDKDNVFEIKQKYKAKLRIIMVSRLIPLKRHMFIFPVFNRLIKQGLDIKVFVLDEGPEKERLSEYIKTNNLENHIILLGFKTDFIDYMAASDIMVHPSITEASNSAVKEMALLEKPSIVCDQVGDFNDYITHGENGFLCDVDKFDSELEEIMHNVYNDPEILEVAGQQCKNSVLRNFSISDQNIKLYTNLIK
ncbi:MAG: glycosyltransferase family 4 protein [bacterium]|nr:glycosyltransferase family 4 protein [bacterium]